MSKKNIVFTALMGTALSSVGLLAQEAAPAGKSEASVQALGSFVKTTTSNGVPQSATNSGGVLASYRYFFNQNHGAELNHGYALNTQSYGLSNGVIGLPVNSHDVSADYV